MEGCFAASNGTNGVPAGLHQRGVTPPPLPSALVAQALAAAQALVASAGEHLCTRQRPEIGVLRTVVNVAQRSVCSHLLALTVCAPATPFGDSRLLAYCRELFACLTSPASHLRVPIWRSAR